MHRIAALMPLVIFTLAGNGTGRSLIREGEPATRAGLYSLPALAALPDGGFLLASDDDIWRVGPDGRIHLTAHAGIASDALAVLPGGGFLMADEIGKRVRMVDPRGAITTVAGGGTSEADGIPATRAQLDSPTSLAVMPGGGFVIADSDRVRRVGPDGIIRTIAGSRDAPDDFVPPPGTPATAVGLNVDRVAVEDDGSVLIAPGLLGGTLVRVLPDGTLAPAAHLPGYVVGLAAAPGGGFYAATALAGPTRVWHVASGGTRAVIAGSGPFTFTAPAGLEQRLAGESALGARLGALGDLAVSPDGGVLLAEEAGDVDDIGGLVRYLAPAAPQTLAAAILRDRDRLISAHAVSVSLTVPATVTLRVAGRTVTRALPAGVSRVPLPPVPATRPQRVRLVAAAPGRAAYDDARIFPRRWLPTETAELVATKVRPAASIVPGGMTCRRFSPTRVDCRRPSCRTTAVVFSHGRLRWTAYGCPFRRRLARPLRPIGGRVTEAEILPSR